MIIYAHIYIQKSHGKWYHECSINEIYWIGFAKANVQNFVVSLLTSLKGSDINTLEDYSSHLKNSCDLYSFFKG